MELLVIVGFAAGGLLYLTKLISYYLLFSPFPRIKKWINATPARLGVSDLIFGYLGMHVIMISGGGQMAMLSMISFSLFSITYILCLLIYRSVSESVQEFWDKRGVS